MTGTGDRAGAVAIGGLLAMAAAMGIGRFVYTPILPFMKVDLGLTTGNAGLIASANYGGYLLGALIASMALLPGGPRSWFLGGLALSALTTGLMGFASTVASFLALRFVGGLASAFVLVFASALVLEHLARAGRPRLSAVHFAGVGTGIAASALVVSGLAARDEGWSAQWMLSGLLCFLAFVVVVVLVPNAKTPDCPAPLPAGRVGHDRRFVSLIGAYGLFGFGYVITATFISTMVRTTPQIREIEPVVWLVVGLTAIPSVALWTWIGRNRGNEWSFALACFVEAAGVALSVLVAESWAVLVAAALLGGTFMGITALGLIQARRLAVGEPRQSLALMTASFGLGQMVGPAFAGYTHGFSGSFLLPSLVASAALLAAAVLVFSTRHVEPRKSS